MKILKEKQCSFCPVKVTTNFSALGKAIACTGSECLDKLNKLHREANKGK